MKKAIMNEKQLEKIYPIVRIFVFIIPAIVIVAGFYLILFPVDTYNFNSADPKLSKFEISKNSENNQLSFGIFPLRNYRYLELTMNLKKSEKENCQNANPEISLTKTYQAFLYPTQPPITDESQLHDLIFANNNTKFPNGSLLHLKPTNEVFLISRGKKILFPGPDVLTAFGYSFDNLTDVEQSDIDLFPDADQKVFLWTMAHPDGTIFQAYPSHSLFLVSDGKLYPIANKEILDQVWPTNFTIPVSDNNSQNDLRCSPKGSGGKISCQFDASKLSNIGRYFSFSIKYPANCSIENVHPDSAKVRFFSEHSTVTVKESLRNIAASVLNRYFYRQY